MRLPLILLVALAAAASAPAARAETRAAGWVSVYGASDGLLVVSPQVDARAEVRRDLEVQGGYEADVISAASVDVQTAASPHGYQEVRHGVRFGATWRPSDEARISMRYTPSWEPDYQSHAVAAGTSREWLGSRLTTELGLRFSLDEVGRAGSSRDTWRPLRTSGASVGVGWILGPRTLGQLTYEAQALVGFQASPYRFVRVVSHGPATFGVSEVVPDQRLRHALAASLRHAITRRWFATVSLRLYRDSWQVTSHTEEVELSRAFDGDRLVLGAAARVYGQSAASFYEPRYTIAGGLPRYRTADKMLARAWSWLGALRASYLVRAIGPIHDLRLTAKVELFDQVFFGFLPLSSREALVGSLGFAGEI